MTMSVRQTGKRNPLKYLISNALIIFNKLATNLLGHIKIILNNLIFLILISITMANNVFVYESLHADIIPEDILQNKLTIYVYENSKKIGIHKWESTKTIQDILYKIQNNNNKIAIYFSPGKYTIDKPIDIFNQNQLEIIGSENTLFSFPNKDFSNNPKLIKDVESGDKTINVNDPDFFKVNHRYHIYKSNKKGDRILEFYLKKIRGKTLILYNPVVKMLPTMEIPAGSLIYEQYNFFDIRQSQNIKIKNIMMDGRNLGEVYGHTIYSGVLVQNSWKDASINKRASFSGLEISNCTFKDLKGRGIAVYNMENIVIKDNILENITTEAIEIDHFASGIVQNNIVKRSGIGLQCNDCYNTVFQGNYLENNIRGIVFLTHYDDNWINTKNIIKKNYLINSVINEFSFGIYARDNNISQNLIQNKENKIRSTGNYLHNKFHNNKLGKKLQSEIKTKI